VELKLRSSITSPFNLLIFARVGKAWTIREVPGIRHSDPGKRLKGRKRAAILIFMI
jgi:hypothetical protein